MIRPRIAVVDYHKGNLLSVERGLTAAGAEACVTDDAALIAACDAAVVPGVGAYEDAMDWLRASGQDRALCSLAGRGAPLLGICLGMQLFFDRGNEHAGLPEPGREAAWTEGLHLMAGEARRLSGDGVKIPHVGWNTADLTRTAARCPLFAGIADETHFYFTHSYICVPDDEAVIIATTEHGQRFASAIWDGGMIFGTQFHPEKSSGAGSAVLRNFVAVVEEVLS